MADVDLGTQVEQRAERQIHTHLSGTGVGEEGRTPGVCTVLTKWAQVWLGLAVFLSLTSGPVCTGGFSICPLHSLI